MGVMLDLVVIPLLKTAVLPLVAALVVVLIFRGKADVPTGSKDWVPALAIALGFALGVWALNGLDTIVPNLSSQWLPYTAFAGFILFLAIPTRQKFLRLVAAVLVIAAVLAIKLHPLFMRESTIDRAWSLAGMFAPLWIVLWLAWDRSLNDDGDYPESLLLCVITATAASLACALDGSVLIGQLAGALAAACGGLFLVKWKIKQVTLGPVFYGTFLAGFGGFLVNAYVYVEANWPGVALAYGSAFPALLTRLPAYKTWSPLKRCLTMSGVALLFLAGVVIYLTMFIPKEYDPYGY